MRSMSAAQTVKPLAEMNSRDTCCRAKIMSRADWEPYSRAIMWKIPPLAPAPMLRLSRTPSTRTPRRMTVRISSGT